jgi:DNA-binding NarL/FixJ family response regulator
VIDPTIKVLICDDHPVVRRGLSALLSAAEDIEVVATAADGEEAVAMAIEYTPDIILMDVSMPGMDGMEATRRLITARPESRVVMLTSFSGQQRIKEALDSGAVGYLLKDSKPEDLIKGIRAAARHAGPTEDN